MGKEIVENVPPHFVALVERDDDVEANAVVVSS
jgi:hypothetical protein